jgi:hypothetical protein
MNPAFKLFLLFFALLFFAPDVAADEWRGITPLRSTRADVVRTLGQCANEEQRVCEFTIDNEDVLIVFSTLLECDGVVPDTVLMIQRLLRTATTFAALQLDKRRFKAFDPSIPRNMGYRGFIDEKAGLLLKTLRGEIFQINHIAPGKEWPVCRAYYGHPREFVEVIWPHVMMISAVECPVTSPVAGERVVIKGIYQETGQRLIPTWYTTAGRIVEGQNTSKIVLDTAGLEGKTVTVTIEVDDSNHHIAAGSCSFTVAPKPNN